MAGQYRQVGDAIAQLVLSVDENGNPTGGESGDGGSTATTYTQIMQADDLQISYFYDDFATPNERVIKIRHTAASLGKRCDEDFLYTFSGQGYSLVSRTRTVEDIPTP